MAEPKKEAYRAYLESAGVIESLTKGILNLQRLLESFWKLLRHEVKRIGVYTVLVSLFEEPDKPVNAVE